MTGLQQTRLLLLGLTLSGCVGWTSDVPEGLRAQLQAWEPAPVTTKTVAFGIKTNLPGWSFTEDQEVLDRYEPLAQRLFPNRVPVETAVSDMLWPSMWPGEQDYAVRIQFQWNGIPADSSVQGGSGVDTSDAASSAFTTGANVSTLFLYGAGSSLAVDPRVSVGMLGLSGLSLGTGIGVALAFTGVGLGLNIVLPHYYEIPVTSVVDIYERRTHRTTRAVIGAMGNLVVWPPLAFIPWNPTAAWGPTINLVIDWSMKVISELEVWQGKDVPLPPPPPQPEPPPAPAPATESQPQLDPHDDALQGNDSLEHARLLARHWRGGLQIASAPDWFAVQVERGELLSASIQLQKDTGNLDLQIWSGEGRVLAWGPQEKRPRKTVRYRSPRAQTLYVRVSGILGARGPYRLEVQ